MKNKKLVNISNLQISDIEKSVLEKGLNFCPTQYKMQKHDFYKDVENFKRNISLKVFFHKEDNTENTEYKSTTLEKLIRKSNPNPFQPPHESCVLAYADAIKDEMERSQ